MRKMYLILLVVCLLPVVYFLDSMEKISSYETIQNALKQKGRFVHIVASLNKDLELNYDPLTNPNHLEFYVSDSTYSGLKVIYQNAKPVDLETSEKLVLKGIIQGNDFHCKEILLKCPSKYKNEESVKTSLDKKLPS